MNVLLKSEAEAGGCFILGKLELYSKTVSGKKTKRRGRLREIVDVENTFAMRFF